MDSAKRPLRILYSLNGSPQYILARSPGPVPIEFIPSSAGAAASSSRSIVPPNPGYASASLKTCLNTICRSSPELIQDRTRDFSVYLLDPLETDCAPAQVKISHSLSQSSIPEAPEARVAVGLGLMSWGLMADESDAMSVTGTLKVSGTGQEMLELIFSLRETIPITKASLPDALRSWGRSSPSPIQTAIASSTQTDASSSNRNGKKPTRHPSRRTSRAAPLTASDKLLSEAVYIGPERQPIGRPPRQKRSDDDDIVVVDRPAAPDLPTLDSEPGKDTIVDFLAFIKAISPEMERNKVLSNVLGLMHGPDGTAVHPPAEFVDALSLFSNSQRISRSQSQPEGAALFNGQHRRKSSSADDEIVVLNKENVNPKVFRRRAERGKEDAKFSDSIEPSGIAPSLLTRSQSQPEPSRFAPSNQPLRRKRTLSEFMEEHESVLEKQKTQKRGQYYRQPERSLADFPSESASTTNHSPARLRSMSVTSSPGPSVVTPATGTSKPVISVSSPPRPQRKKYVVPAWARTATATQPRLSDRVVQKVQQKEQEEENKRTQVERKKTEARRKVDRGALKEGGKRRGPPSTAAAKRKDILPSRTDSVASVPSLPAPVAASSEFPVFSGIAAETSRSHYSAPPPESPPRQDSQKNIIPCTPPRKRANTIATPGGPSSLFTPASASASWQASGVLEAGRSSMSPSCRKAPRQDTDPPFEDDLLSQELDSAFNELDLPPSSLPMASDDNDTTKHVHDYESDDSEDADVPPKEHWIGLPPSSPPLPSSPYTSHGSLVDDDVDELRLATSEADMGPELETINYPDTELTDYSAEELSNLFTVDDLSRLLSVPADSNDTASLLDQFTNRNLELSSDDSAMMDWGLDATNPDFDLTEFWESVRPLVGDSSSNLSDMNGQPNDGELGGIDHAKLAGDVHALFSGCLV
ncbi:hypothetical protein GGX14DRAFT_499075 [Mycena pura]|uniref:Ams2/SPT21 N-terminal domain-containing protein n=1 Tax=Mycena pura TaxID=153505 RepID=A0AAD6VD99_9AGAR|nr:hypothetical protein GGX14DRAFT_499075 [Mycena pura]